MLLYRYGLMAVPTMAVIASTPSNLVSRCALRKIVMFLKAEL